MIALEDCLALCGLTEDQVLALAEHEHIPEIAAAALAAHLLCQADGCKRIRSMLLDDIRAAQLRGDEAHVAELVQSLNDFVCEHPEAGRMPKSIGAYLKN